jgi:hypothetical protein
MAIVIKGFSKPVDPPTAPPSAPPPEPTNPITAALNLSSGTASAPSETPPWEVEENYTILDALKDMGTPSKRGKTLWLIHKQVSGIKYQVLSWDQQTSRAVLEGHKKSQLKPVISERESFLYYPVWV